MDTSTEYDKYLSYVGHMYVTKLK